MSKKIQIKQSTFDDVVKENVDDLNMSPRDAVDFAVEQFESQGVDLSCIVKTMTIIEGEDGLCTVNHAVLNSLKKIDGIMRDSIIQEEQLCREMQQLIAECNKGLPYRLLASSNNALDILMSCWKKYACNDKMLVEIIDTLISLLNGQPDVVNTELLQSLQECLESSVANPVVSCKLIILAQLICMKHEQNRQLLAVAFFPIAKLAVESQKKAEPVVRAFCKFVRSLVVDDDIRVEFGKAHEHAKLIVIEYKGLQLLMELLQIHMKNLDTLSEILSTINRLAVRSEFCKNIVDDGGLQIVLQTLLDNMDNQVVVRSVLGLLKAISGNDEVKSDIVKSNGASAVLSALAKNKDQPSVCEAGFGAMAMLTLRSPSNCTIFVEAGAASLICDIMKLHPNEAGVQKQACLAIRNLVARTREYCPLFLELETEKLIRTAWQNHQQIEDMAKAALRDLGCDVHLEERWTGEKGGLKM